MLYNWLEVVRIFAEKVTKELEVIKLAFSNFLYNKKFRCYSYYSEQYSYIEGFAYVCYHQLYSPATGRKSLINIVMTFAHFSLKKQE